jgi:hypothetical protein
MIEKVQAYIIRKEPRHQLLLFEHDIKKLFQVIRGTLEPMEKPEIAVMREIAEESGLTSATLIKKLGAADLEIPGGPTRTGPLETQRHHAFLFEAPKGLPNHWTHFASGSQEEEGLKFHFSWHPIDESLFEILTMEEMKYFIPLLMNTVK